MQLSLEGTYNLAEIIIKKLSYLVLLFSVSCLIPHTLPSSLQETSPLLIHSFF